MSKRFIMSIDQGTTGTRVALFDERGRMHSTAYREIRQIFAHPGWVEHDANEYWDTTIICAAEAMQLGDTNANEIAAIGITCQRETTVLWDKDTGEPVYNAIVWQSRQTAAICEELIADGLDEYVREKTGLLIDAYFSATKIKWIIDNVDGVKEKVKQGKILFGNIDSFLMFKLSGGAAHVEDYSNASRTMLLDIHTLQWDDKILDALDIPKSMLPKLMPSSGVMCETDKDVFFGQAIPIAGDAGDQHAATFGQTCFKPGMAKNTYGTALAMMMNVGYDLKMSKTGLTSDIAWMVGERPEYALEGLVFMGGATIQWLRDGLKIIKTADEVNDFASRVSDTGGVYLVPAFTGLCAPYWDMYARGTIVGMTRGTTGEHIARSALEAIAYQTCDVLECMTQDSGQQLTSLRVDGGATASDFLMQFQADILGIPIEKPVITEMTSLGAAYLAGLGIGFWKNKEEIAKQWQVARVFEPNMNVDQKESLYSGWKRAVKRSFAWAQE
ncbi:MAG: glycerol kinase GlpK [Clostridia bacterium]|jgi:glycerol kinase|nr:glycerol kinase GlpK [Clostridia bacterium]